MVYQIPRREAFVLACQHRTIPRLSEITLKPLAMRLQEWENQREDHSRCNRILRDWVLVEPARPSISMSSAPTEGPAN